jgi:Ca2+-binding RTX toxin-like protein
MPHGTGVESINRSAATLRSGDLGQLADHFGDQPTRGSQPLVVARGTGGDDTLRGGDADDHLYGGNGADNLDGGPGFHDYCVAGPGGLATVNCE